MSSMREATRSPSSNSFSPRSMLPRHESLACFGAAVPFWTSAGAGLCERENWLPKCGTPSTVTFPRGFQRYCPGSSGFSSKRPCRQTVFSLLTWSRRQVFSQNHENLPWIFLPVESSQPGTLGRSFSNSPLHKRLLRSSYDSDQYSGGIMAN